VVAILSSAKNKELTAVSEAGLKVTLYVLIERVILIALIVVSALISIGKNAAPSISGIPL
jgi:hypothetical protein